MPAPPDLQRKGPHQKIGRARREVENNRNLPKILDDIKPWSWGLPSLDEQWPDIHDHISQLADAGVLPSEEDHAA
jgi:hypothetical protein